MRFARLAWLLVFLVPLGFFADRFCYLNLVDPAFHTLMWMHERLLEIFAGLAILSAAAAVARFVRIQGQLSALEALRSDPPLIVGVAFDTAGAGRVGVDLVYIDVASAFCFATIGNRVVISRGFVELLDRHELRLVAEHEETHIRHRDPQRALLWHLLFAALIVPGFEPIERMLYARREREADRHTRTLGPAIYDSLVHRFGSAMCSTPGAAFRALQAPSRAEAMRVLAPTAVPIGLLILLLASHVVFVQNLPYLQTHHC